MEGIVVKIQSPVKIITVPKQEDLQILALMDTMVQQEAKYQTRISELEGTVLNLMDTIAGGVK